METQAVVSLFKRWAISLLRLNLSNIYRLYFFRWVGLYFFHPLVRPFRMGLLICSRLKCQLFLLFCHVCVDGWALCTLNSDRFMNFNYRNPLSYYLQPPLIFQLSCQNQPLCVLFFVGKKQCYIYKSAFFFNWMMTLYYQASLAHTCGNLLLHLGYLISQDSFIS